jgi:hypothetical protein
MEMILEKVIEHCPMKAHDVGACYAGDDAKIEACIGCAFNMMPGEHGVEKVMHDGCEAVVSGLLSLYKECEAGGQCDASCDQEMEALFECALSLTPCGHDHGHEHHHHEHHVHDDEFEHEEEELGEEIGELEAYEEELRMEAARAHQSGHEEMAAELAEEAAEIHGAEHEAEVAMLEGELLAEEKELDMEVEMALESGHEERAAELEAKEEEVQMELHYMEEHDHVHGHEHPAEPGAELPIMASA